MSKHRLSTNELTYPNFGAKPPREVSIRVKFIRLGEVRTLFILFKFTLMFY